MYKHLLVPTDGSDLSLAAIQQAAKFARTLGAAITVLNVQPEYPAPVVGEGLVAPIRRDFEEEYAKTANAVLDIAAREIDRAGLGCQRRIESSSKPWEAIIKVATNEACDLVFMASHGRSGLAGLLIGSETQKVLTHCKIPVLVYR
jgi:nucleotide-binding universal stress UspA family protein